MKRNWLALLALLLLTAPAALQGQDLQDYDYATNADDATIAILGYSGPGGDITIPATINGLPVTSIGYTAFYFNSSLTNVTIPDSVTSIGDDAFFSCTSLTSITIPGNVAYFGVWAFGQCASLTNALIANGVTSIGDLAFADDTSLASVTIPASVGSIGEDTFFSCTSLTIVTIPAGVTNIGGGAFADCTSLTSLLFTGNAPTIGLDEFGGDNNAIVYYSPGTTGWSDFSTNAGVPAVLWNPLSLSEFDYTTNAGCITITGYTGPGGAVVLPFAVNGLPVTSIGDGVFFETSLTGVIIPGSVTSIGDLAFYGCSNLTNLTLPGNVTNIGPFAFYGCASLANITIPGSIGDATFYGCTNLNTATILAGVTSIGDLAFFGCSSLASVTIQGSPTNIGESAFADCSNLNIVYFEGNAPIADSSVFDTDNKAMVYYLSGSTGWSSTFAGAPTVELQTPYSFAINTDETITITGYTGPGGIVTLPESLIGLPVTCIGNDVFQNSYSLTCVAIPGGITTIGNSAFAGCYRLTNAVIAVGVASIGDQAFAWSGLTSVIIPGSVTSVGNSAFQDCFSLANAVIAVGVTTIGDQAFQNTGLISVIIPRSVTYVGNYAFSSTGVEPAGLKSITVDAQDPFYSSLNGVLFDKMQTTLIQYPGAVGGSYTIPDGVTSIGVGAFMACRNLNSVTIPGSVTNIGDYAFAYFLASVYFKGNAPIIGFSTFLFGPETGPAYGTVYCLPGTTGWSDFIDYTGFPATLWNPGIVTGDGAFGVRTNYFSFNITNAANLTVVVEVCTNLASPVWVPLTTNTLDNGVFYFSEAVQANTSGRFYGLGLP